MLPIVIGSIAGLFCLWVFRNAEETARALDQAICNAYHRVGPIILRHYEAIDCIKAIEVAEMAWEIWEQVEPEFPGRLGEFVLFLIFDRKRGPGSQRVGKIIINLAKYDDTEELIDTMAEELYHLAESMVGIEEDYVFKPEFPCERKLVVRYYAENPQEYRALCFAVALVGKRKKLLEEVEEYRALHNIS